jgi:fructose-1,6-bisphosphatase I
MLKGTTFTRFILEERRRNPGATGDFTALLGDIATACKEIAAVAGRGNLIGECVDRVPAPGEIERKLDIVANDILMNCVEWTGCLAGLASEEMETVYPIPAHLPRGNYLLVFDPLDGSSNTEIDVALGTIFSVLRCPQGVAVPGLEHFLQKGTRQVCAGYAIYGPATLLVLTTGRGVNGFTLERSSGEFILTHPNRRIPADTREFAINMSNQRLWDSPVQRYIRECLQGAQGSRGKNFNMRWIATLVAEVHRILNRGGVFLYPRDRREPRQSGRIRLMYEANPMAFIIEQAGGAASTGHERMLDVQPAALHQRVPVILGARHEVERIVAYHRED